MLYCELDNTHNFVYKLIIDLLLFIHKFNCLLFMHVVMPVFVMLYVRSLCYVIISIKKYIYLMYFIH